MTFRSDPSSRFIFAFLPFLAGFFLFFTTCGNIAKSIQAEQWTLIRGEAVRDFRSGIELHFYRPFTMRSAKRLYRYKIEGRHYSGTAVGFGVFRGLSDISKGDRVGVYVNPDNLLESTLVVGFTNSHLFTLLAAAACFYLGLFLWQRT